MMLEAVWLKNGKEVYCVNPVMNVLCEDDMNNISEIEVYDGYHWHTYENVKDGADDFVIRVKRG